MDVESSRGSEWIFFFLVEHGILRELSVAAHLNILLPIEFMLLYPSLIERIIIQVSILLSFGHYGIDVIMDQVTLLIKRVHLKELLHANHDRVTSPSEAYLLVFDLVIHEVSCKEEHQLWIECFLSDLFNEKPKLKDVHSVPILLVALQRIFGPTVLKHKLSRANIEEDIFLDFPWSLSLGKCVDPSWALRRFVFLNLLLVELLLDQGPWLGLYVDELHKLAVANEWDFDKLIKSILVSLVILVKAKV